jgi:hypothetical protein
LGHSRTLTCHISLGWLGSGQSLGLCATVRSKRLKPICRQRIHHSSGETFGKGSLVSQVLYLGHDYALRQNNLKQIASFQACCILG